MTTEITAKEAAEEIVQQMSKDDLSQYTSGRKSQQDWREGVSLMLANDAWTHLDEDDVLDEIDAEIGRLWGQDET